MARTPRRSVLFPTLPAAGPAFLVAMGLVGALLLAGCRPSADEAPGVRLEWSVRPEPPETGPAVVSLNLTDGDSGEPVAGARVRLEGTMSHPGMSPVFATAREIEPGRYRASIELTMAGDWILLVEAALADGRTLRRQVALPGVRTGRSPAGAGGRAGSTPPPVRV